MTECVIRTGDRGALIDGLRDLADFLSANPEILVPPRTSTGVLVNAIDPYAREEGAQVAADLLGAPLEDLGHGFFLARRHFGPVTYYVTAVPPKGQP